MSFSDLFDSGFQLRNKGHFSAIARVALTDGKISAEEKAFLDKLAVRLEISPAEYGWILEDAWKYPSNPPYWHGARRWRVFCLARIVHVDHHLGDKQELLLRKFCIALGFNVDNVDYIVDKSLKLVDKKVDLDAFLFEMTNMNQ